MNRFVMSLALLAIFAQGLTFGQDPPLLTRDMGNGRFWNAMDATQKAIYLRGDYDGIYSIDRTQLKIYFPASLTFKEYAKMIDDLYSQPENMPLPITIVMLVATMKSNGVDPSTVDGFLSEMRAQEINAAHETNKK